jgi:hypothetical protein
LFVPLSQPESLRVFISCAAPKGTKPIPVEVRLNGTHLGSFVPTSEMTEQSMIAPRRLWKRINLIEIVPLVDKCDVFYLAVDRLRFEHVPVS